jgi:hypothetical protein
MCSILQNMQVLEEEKSKLDAFCEQSLKTVSVIQSSVYILIYGSEFLCVPTLLFRSHSKSLHGM